MNLNNRCFLVLLLACLFLAGSASALTVSIGDGSGPKGSMVQIPVSFEGAASAGSMDLVISYDPAVAKAMGVDTGSLGANSYLESNTGLSGEVKIALANSAGISGSGPVAVITFLVSGDAGASTPLTVKSVSIHNLELTEVPATPKNGSLRVTEGAAPTKSGNDVTMILGAIGAVLAGIYLSGRR